MSWGFIGFLLVLAALACIYISYPRRPVGSSLGPRPSMPDDGDVKAISAGRCPCCGSTELLEGPAGGINVNIACGNCLQEFNIASWGGGILMVDRSGRMSQSRATVFGINADMYRRLTDG